MTLNDIKIQFNLFYNDIMMASQSEKIKNIVKKLHNKLT